MLLPSVLSRTAQLSLQLAFLILPIYKVGMMTPKPFGILPHGIRSCEWLLQLVTRVLRSPPQGSEGHRAVSLYPTIRVSSQNGSARFMGSFEMGTGG